MWEPPQRGDSETVFRDTQVPPTFENEKRLELSSVRWMEHHVRHVDKKKARPNLISRALKLEELIQYQLLSSKLAMRVKAAAMPPVLEHF